MKFKGGTTTTKIPIDMTPMIDCVFQLMIFFMLTLKIRADEGDFGINMPLGNTGSSASQDLKQPDLKVRLIAGPSGNLAQLKFMGLNLGTGDKAYASLNNQILQQIGKPGSAQSKEREIEIDADYDLHYQEVVKAISACTGKVDPATKEVVRYVEKIKFAPPRQGRGS